ncbi:MAG: cell division protein FtsQ/DivIB [Sterolibacterium sp.]|nr:cell division protein FtsQ/DivIB [Sterolibacterium sp.]
MPGGRRDESERARSRSRPDRRSKSRPAVEGFWDRPPLLNMVADTLMLFGMLGLLYAAILAVVRLPVFPLHQVVVVSPLDQVTRTQIDYVVQHSLDGNFFTVNLDNMRASFEKLPWVRKASLRRRWPDGIEVELEEHVAVARWQNSAGEARLVNRQGEVFGAALNGSQNRLPLFAGPEGTSAQVLAHYQGFSELLAPSGRSLRVVQFSPRQAWQLRLDDGLVLELGREQGKATLHDRLERFVTTYAAVKSRVSAGVGVPQIAAIDMRYPNGFALRTGKTTQNSGKGNT